MVKLVSTVIKGIAHKLPDMKDVESGFKKEEK